MCVESVPQPMETEVPALHISPHWRMAVIVPCDQGAMEGEMENSCCLRGKATLVGEPVPLVTTP